METLLWFTNRISTMPIPTEECCLTDIFVKTKIANGMPVQIKETQSQQKTVT